VGFLDGWALGCLLGLLVGCPVGAMSLQQVYE
jgi:hypothetical protein